MTEWVKLLVVDDHTLFREGVVALLNSVPEIEVVGMAEDGQQAVEMAAKVQPDVILMDIQMPKINGIAATRQIINDHPDMGVIVLTMFEDDDSVFAAMRAGARGYILKGADQEDMLRAIRAVARGEALFGPSIAERLKSYLAPQDAAKSEAFPELTQRELEILELIAQGMSNAEISENLVIAVKTVRNHVSNIFNKLQVADRVQAVIRAREAGLGKDGGGF